MENSSSTEHRLLESQPEQEDESLRARILEESNKIWRVAMPSAISRVSSFGTIVVTQSFVGHISSLDLASYALVQTLTVRFVNGILIGMSSATETLCGQSFGAKQYSMMGIYLQRSWLIFSLTLAKLLPAFIFGAQISLWFIPFVISLNFSLSVQMYLQAHAQLKNMIVAWLAALQFVIHILCSWIFVYVVDFGVGGAMASLAISSWFIVFGEFVYVVWHKSCSPQDWHSPLLRAKENRVQYSGLRSPRNKVLKRMQLSPSGRPDEDSVLWYFQTACARIVPQYIRNSPMGTRHVSMEWSMGKISNFISKKTPQV